MARGDSWRLNPDGSVLFDTPSGSLPLAGADAAAEAARRDTEAGVQRPLSFYQSLARPPSMATSQGAMADASGVAGAGGAPPQRSDATPDRPLAWDDTGGTPAFSVPTPPPPDESPDTLPAPPVDETTGGTIGSSGSNPYVSEAPTARSGARVNAPAGWVDPNAGKASAAPAAVDPTKVVTAKPGAGGGTGSGGLAKAAREARGTIDETTRYQQEAVEAGEKSRLVADQRQAEVMREQNAIEATYQAGREERLRELHERTRQYDAKLSQTLADHDKMQVDPNRWMSSRTAGQRVLLTIGAFLSGFGGDGDSNQVLDLMNKRIDNDIRSQIENRDSKLKQATATQALYKDYLATFKDHDEAILATATTAKMGIAKAAMQQALETGSPEQMARAEELHAKLLEQQAAQYGQLAQQRAAALAKGAGAPKKGPRTIMVNGVSYPVRPNVTDAEYNKLTEEAQKVDRVYRTVAQAEKTEAPGLGDRFAATLGYKTQAQIRAEATADSVQSADSQLSGEGTSSETAVKTGREKFGGVQKTEGLREERKKADAAAIDLVRRATQ